MDAKQVKRVTTRVHKLAAKWERIQKRRQRLERRRKAVSDFNAGRISKTELRKHVPRSWLT